jgi:hypothetical protein
MYSGRKKYVLIVADIGQKNIFSKNHLKKMLTKGIFDKESVVFAP